MATRSKQIAIDLPPSFCLYTDGTITRYYSPRYHRPSDDSDGAVRSKDVVVVPETSVSVRIFLPRRCDPKTKLPLVLYIHGGAFCIGSATSPMFHNFVAAFVEKANVVAVSVDYRLAPEHPLPIPYDDCWAAFQWVAAHAEGTGPDPWLTEHVDFRRVFIGGESAGANIANNVAIRAGEAKVKIRGLETVGVFLIHPYFGRNGSDLLYNTLCPDSNGMDEDPRMNPVVDPRIGGMAGRVMLFVAEKDFLRERGWIYYERLKKSEWNGEVEMMESEGEEHCFYLFNPTSPKAEAIMDKLVAFLTQSTITPYHI